MRITEKPPNELKHYGVLGMRWGHHKREETSSKPNQSKSEEPKKGLTDKQKKALKIGAIAVASALAIYGGYKLSQSESFKQLVRTGRQKLLETTDLNLDRDPHTGFAKTDKVDIGCINKINLFKPGTYMNCGNSTIALELRKRGLDVVAKENPTGMYDLHMGQYFNLKSDAIRNLSWGNISDINPNKADMVRSALQKEVSAAFPDGSRGSVLLPLTNGNHFIGWSLNQGKLIFEDAQNPKIDFNALFSSVSRNTFLGKKYDGAQFVRLDNAEINARKIREVVKDRLKFSIANQPVKDLDFDLNTIEGVGFILKNFNYV